jgi:anti-sigma-K factor RskA
VITCQEADVLAAALSVGSIDRADQSALQLHLAGCADCRRRAAEYMAAAARLPLALEPVAPSPELRGRLMRAVYAEAGQAERRAVGASASWWRRVWGAVPASRALTVAAAGAAIVVIGLSSWAVASRQDNSPASVSVALAASQAAPHAQALLTYQRGSGEAVLTAKGLPSPNTVVAHAAVYEVWLIRGNGSAVGAAYLSQDPDGTWSAAIHGDLTAYTAVAATPEPAGGSPGPTGARVIQGSLGGS